MAPFEKMRTMNKDNSTKEEVEQVIADYYESLRQDYLKAGINIGGLLVPEFVNDEIYRLTHMFLSEEEREIKAHEELKKFLGIKE